MPCLELSEVFTCSCPSLINFKRSYLGLKSILGLWLYCLRALQKECKYLICEFMVQYCTLDRTASSLLLHRKWKWRHKLGWCVYSTSPVHSRPGLVKKKTAELEEIILQGEKFYPATLLEIILQRKKFYPATLLETRLQGEKFYPAPLLEITLQGKKFYPSTYITVRYNTPGRDVLPCCTDRNNTPGKEVLPCSYIHC